MEALWLAAERRSVGRREMNVVLDTNAPEVLELRSLRRFRDDSGFVCRLAVRSRAFSAEHDFYFDRPGLQAFVKNLTAMDHDLTGRAELRTPYEDDRIALEVVPTGSVLVSGELFEHSEHSQKLVFSFRTDQTCLGAFARQLSLALDMPAV